MTAEQDTIFAASSGSGRAAILVMRISGSDTGRILDALCRSRPPPRDARLRTLRAPAGPTGTEADEILDRAVILWLPGPHSYTGEDCGELHLHGGRAVREGVAQALLRLGARPAEAGEFTRRALLNGRVDLLEAEAIGDLVAAETAAQRRQALRQMDGALGDLYRDWADRLRRLLAFQEALIDFADDDLPASTETELLTELTLLRAALAAHLDDGGRGEALREGLAFAVAGAPNVGKSRLVNALARREAAIVSPVAGTTRDAIEVPIDLDGVPVTLVDTAGLREPADEIEAEGVRRAMARAQSADLVVWVTDATAVAIAEPQISVPLVRVANKCDLGATAASGMLAVSALTGAGLERLRERLCVEAKALVGVHGPPPLTRARHRSALGETARRLDDAIATCVPELRAEELRLALRGIGRVTGSVRSEDVLDTLFATFCIGK